MLPHGSCGMNGCIYKEFHDGPHSNEVNLEKRKTIPPLTLLSQQRYTSLTSKRISCSTCGMTGHNKRTCTRVGTLQELQVIDPDDTSDSDSISPCTAIQANVFDFDVDVIRAKALKIKKRKDEHFLSALSYAPSPAPSAASSSASQDTTNHYDTRDKRHIRFQVIAEIQSRSTKQSTVFFALIDVPNGITKELLEKHSSISCEIYIFNFNEQDVAIMRTDYSEHTNVHVICANVIDICPIVKMDVIWIDGMTDFYSDEIMEHFRTWANPNAFLAYTYTCRSRSHGGYKNRAQMIRDQDKRLTYFENEPVIHSYKGINSMMINIHGIVVTKPVELSKTQIDVMQLLATQDWATINQQHKKRYVDRLLKKCMSNVESTNRFELFKQVKQLNS